MANPQLLKDLKVMSHEVRKDIFQITKTAKSGHIGGCSSSVELMMGLYFGGILKYNPRDPKEPNRDRVLVRGHLGPLRYKIFSLLGWISEDELSTYRQLGSRLQGHEDMFEIPGVDITPSGSLGMLLSYGVGSAIVARNLGLDFTNYVFLGDGEEQEGNISEAARHASNLGLEKVIAIIDKNQKQLSHRTTCSDNMSDLDTIWRGYGWEVLEIEDGHDLEQVISTYRKALDSNKQGPKLIIANTIKGKGIEGCDEHFSGYHTISTIRQQSKVDDAIASENEALKEVPNINEVRRRLKKRVTLPKETEGDKRVKGFEEIQPSKLIAEYRNHFDTIVDYFRQLNTQTLTSECPLYILTSDLIKEDEMDILDMENSRTHLIDVGIREQHMTALAHGLCQTDKKAKVIMVASEEFTYRHADQMNALSQAGSNVVIIGNTGGISGAKNGKTHQSSGQSGMLGLMPGMRCLEPSDAVDFFHCMNSALDYDGGPTYVRLHSGPLPVYDTNTNQNINFYTTSDHPCPRASLIGNGLTMKGCMEARDILQKEGINLRVLNVVDRNSLNSRFVESLEGNKPAFTIYNGNPDSLSYPVSNVVMKSQSQRPSRIISHGFLFGTSGDLGDLIKYFRFDGEGIAEIVRSNV